MQSLMFDLSCQLPLTTHVQQMETIYSQTIMLNLTINYLFNLQIMNNQMPISLTKTWVC